MKSLLLLAGMLLVLDVQAQSSFVSGNKLLDNCLEIETRPSSFKTGVCAGYVSSVVDSLAFQASGNLHACIPPQGVTVRQAVAVVTKYFRDYPEKLHYSAYTSAVLALSISFPCSK